MSKPNYRVILTYDAERTVFLARAPELEHCAGEGASRAEATARVEEEIDAQLANMLSHGTTPPRSVDEETFSGEITAKVSKTLHRDLAYQARTEGIDLDHLIGELLAAAMEPRKQTHRGRTSGNRTHEPSDNVGNRHEGGGQQRRGFGGGRGNYQLLDDRANFIEYVRGLENNGGYNAQGGHRGGGHGGGPGGGGGGGGDRRRRRRGGGPGGGQGFRNDQRGQHNGNGRPAQNFAPAAPAQAAAPPPSGSDNGGDAGPHDDGDGNV
jgi:predicted RNase H-like HicB family nuclease